MNVAWLSGCILPEGKLSVIASRCNSNQAYLAHSVLLTVTIITTHHYMFADAAWSHLRLAYSMTVGSLQLKHAHYTQLVQRPRAHLFSQTVLITTALSSLSVTLRVLAGILPVLCTDSNWANQSFLIFVVKMNLQSVPWKSDSLPKPGLLCSAACHGY